MPNKTHHNKTHRNNSRRNFVNTMLRHNGQSFIRRVLAKIVSLLLITSILTVSTPAAAPSILVSATGELAQDFRFAYHSGNWAVDLPTVLGFFVGGGTAAADNEQVSRVQIFPGSITVNRGEMVVLSAVAYNSADEPLSGIDFRWRVIDRGNAYQPRDLRAGTFKAVHLGTFTVTAKIRGKEAAVTVTVIPAVVPPVVSTTNPETSRSAKDKRSPAAKSALAAPTDRQSDSTTDDGEKPEPGESSPDVPNLSPPGGWGPDNEGSSNDPGNQPGSPPGSPADDGAGSGNFQLSAPVVSLPGRGIDLALNLNYNSRLWNKAGSQMNYDIDRGFPGPGWSLGFGKMIFMGAASGCMMVDADGTRHGYSGFPTSSSTGAWFEGHTTDSSLIDYGCSVIYGQASYGWAKLPNGTTVNYSNYGPGNDMMYPTKITDAQGNFITVTYRSGREWEIETVTDTMGRVISFQYDSNNRLISIIAPRMTGQGAQYGTKAIRTLVRFHYRQLPLNYSFANGVTAVLRDNNPNPWVLDSIYYPATDTGYWFGGADANHPDYASYYSSYGMLTKVEEQRGMSFLSGPDEQGTIVPGQMSKRALYNYPLTTGDGPATGRTNGSNLSDAPTYETLTENWAGMDVAEDTVTTYSINNNDYHYDGTTNSPARTITVTQPNGAISKQYTYRTPDAWTDGLVFADETILMNGTTPVVVGSSLVSWQQGHYQAPRPSWVETTDENGDKRKTVFDYAGGLFNQVTRSCDYDDGGAKLRCATNQYENSPAYIGQFDAATRFTGGRHIFNLVKATGVENPDGTLASWTEYEYDNYQSQPFINAPGVIQHEHNHNLYTAELKDGACLGFDYPTCTFDGEIVWVPTAGGYEHNCRCTGGYDQVSVYDPSTEKRGNVTKVTTYTDANNRTAGAIYETRAYDITGNLITASTACCQQTSFQYTDTTQYAYPESQTRGASDPNSPDRITTSAVYSFAVGLVTQSTDANGRISYSNYHPDTLRPTRTTSSTGAYLTYAYDDAAMTVAEESFAAGGGSAGKTVTILNGVGQTRREESRGANNVWDYTETKYNKLGQVWKQSRPYRAGDTLQWTTTIYDGQGRTVETIAPDDSRSKAFYNERTQFPDSATKVDNALPPGNTIRVADAWGRERWGRYDQQNRLVEVVEPKADGDGKIATAGSLLTKYRYDTLGRLIETEQGSQTRRFKYDDLGRLTRQKLAEQSATLNDAGAFVGAGASGAQWGEAFTYDNRSNLTRKTDARGVRTSYAYGDVTTGAEDPLNRLKAVIYDTNGPLEANLIVHAAYNVTYEYMTTGDKSRIKKVETPGLMKEEYVYDPEGRVQDYTQTIAARETRPFVTSYLYDTLSRVTEVRYPAQYGMTGNPRRLIEHSYDTASRLTSLKVNGTEQAGNIAYNAADQTTAIKIGAAGANQVTESYTFDSQTGLLTNQKAEKGAGGGGNTLLDLSYEYDRKNSVGTGTGKTGHLSKIVDNLNNNKNREYEYDALGRLTKAKGGSNLWQQTYTYDRYGNRTNVAATGVAADPSASAIPIDGIPNLAYDNTSNRITTSGYQYDAAGNQTRAISEDGVNWLKYEYDAANRLRIIKRDDGSPNGVPVQAISYGATNARIFDYNYAANYLKVFATLGGTTLSEYTENVSATPTWTKSYIYLGSSLLSTATPNGTNSEHVEYSHPDRLGTRTITNQQAGTNYEQTTLPFGTALNAESTANTNNRFTSYDRSSATGLDYAVNRTYDSKQGRFTQVDPIKMRATSLASPQTLNLYNYCGNDPINHTDPDGLFFGSLFKWIGKAFKWLMVAVMVATAILTVVGTFMAAPAFAAFLKTGIGQVLSVIAGLPSAIGNVLSGVSKTIANIFSFATEKAMPMVGWGVMMAGSSVGAIANNLVKKERGQSSEAVRRAKITIDIYNNAIKRLRSKPKCAAFIKGKSSFDPEIELIKTPLPYGGSGPIGPGGQIIHGTVADAAGKQGTASATIYLNDEFFDKSGSVGGWKARSTMNTRNARTLVVLHELKHVVGGYGHPVTGNPTVDEADPESNTNWNKDIAKHCFGVTFK